MANQKKSLLNKITNDEVIRYLDLGMFPEAKVYCMGVLKGIYQYEQEAESGSKDWFADVPAECSYWSEWSIKI
ncbi:MAG: hypothetical protein HQ542_02640 [Bacteroidia bacterium]|nr:hypothetical protein [Bacteroidia bacterium]